MKIEDFPKEQWPPSLLQIPSVPKKLYIVGTYPKTAKYLAVVGSRKYSSYGAQCVRELIGTLAGQDITIVSGLALGIDSLAHEAALEFGLPTIAVPGSGLSPHVLFPRSHVKLAERIVEAGGCILSEFEPDFISTIWSFPQRNRIMAGLTQASLIIEAEEKSGTLITARLAADYNRDVLVVPGSIFSDTSIGTNQLLRLGATPITCADDLLEALKLTKKTPAEERVSKFANCSPEELQIIEVLRQQSMSRDELLRQLDMPIPKANSLLSIMEIKGLIEERLGELYIS